MEFIGTEVGIKIRSAIKAKLTELGKTVDDELIDYIMVMVANKKEEIQMSRDLQPFLESDTNKFTSWLHKVLQKLEQVTVIVTDEEFKIATTAFGKVNKKRKSTETSGKKKSSSKDEPKEKKKKLKHEHSSKHTKSTGSTDTEVSKVITKENVGLKSKNVSAATAKPNKAKKSKLSVIGKSVPIDCQDAASKVVTSSIAGIKSNIDMKTPIVESDSSELYKKSAVSDVNKIAVRTTANVVPLQRPVTMMVSDDDDDDDDFINIKTDVAEENELLDEERAQRSAGLVSDTAPVSDQDNAVTVTLTLPLTQTRTVVLDTVQSEPIKTQPLIDEGAVRQTLAAPRSVMSAIVSTVAPSRRNFKQQQRNSVPDSSPAQKSRPPILSRVGAVLKRKASHLSNDEEDDEGELKNGSVASIVKVKPRPKLPAAAQAPKNLLLRAMADAHRSVASAPVREEIQQPSKSKRSPLFTRKFRDHKQERIAVTLPNVREPSESAVEEVGEAEEAEKDELEEIVEPDEAYVPELVTNPSTLPLDMIYSPSPIAKPVKKTETGQSSQRCGTPEFLVTLDGYKSYSGSGLSRTIVCAPEREEQQEEEHRAQEEDESQHSSPEKPRRQKIVFTTKLDAEDESETQGNKSLPLKSLDRCKFWPACRLGDSCTFHHPTQICKSFPSCQFGDRCLYIHPNCKFDASCTRKDCPFTHASPRNLASLTVPVVIAPRPVVQRLGPPLTCRFFPNCTNTNCRFYHPKACRYGVQCSKPDCTFSHAEFPPKAKMKWVSSI